MMRRTILAASVAILTAFVPVAVSAGALNVDCRRPFVFRDADVNVVLLPYTYFGSSARLTETSRQLSLLVQIETLFSIMKYGRVGAVQHVTPSPTSVTQCTPEIVIDKLLGRTPGAEAQVQPGRGLVVLSGRFYEARGQVYIQSYIRFLRRSVAEEGFSFTIDDRRFAANISASGFAFTPRLITRESLQAMEATFRQTLRIHHVPQLGSSSEPVLLDPSRALTYSIQEVRGNWIRLQPNGGAPAGWVQMESRRDEASLRRRLPELIFVEGVAGYLSARINPAGPNPLSTRRSAAASALREALREYEDAPGKIASPTPLARGVGKQLLGLLRLGGNPTAADLNSAVLEFDEALVPLPNDASARNLASTARLYRAFHLGEPVGSPSRYLDDYLASTSLDPRNAEVLGNLAGLLQLMDAEVAGKGTLRKRFEQIDMPAGEIQKRLTAVQAVRVALGSDGSR